MLRVRTPGSEHQTSIAGPDQNLEFTCIFFIRYARIFVTLTVSLDNLYVVLLNVYFSHRGKQLDATLIKSEMTEKLSEMTEKLEQMKERLSTNAKVEVSAVTPVTGRLWCR